jgi:predicted ATPase
VSCPIEPPQDEFVGRTTELAWVLGGMRARERLLTLVGPAGIGKTHLALRSAAALRRARRRACFCDLTQARSKDDIGAAVARVLGVPVAVLGTSDDGIELLGRHLASRGSLVLVLDNLEQVLEHTPATLGRWLANAPRLQLLVTSRERLRLMGERCLELGPLGVPAVDEHRVTAIAGAEAVALFLVRARAASTCSATACAARPNGRRRCAARSLGRGTCSSHGSSGRSPAARSSAAASI